MIKYPEIRVQLTGTDGNGFAVLGKMRGALERGGVPPDQVTAFFAEATTGDYNHLLETCMKWADVR